MPDPYLHWLDLVWLLLESLSLLRLVEVSRWRRYNKHTQCVEETEAWRGWKASRRPLSQHKAHAVCSCRCYPRKPPFPRP